MAYIGNQPSTKVTGNYTVDTFTGNGSNVDFTLSYAVPVGNPAAIEVYVANVAQQPTISYSISGSDNKTLSFTEAPANGDPIYVIAKGEIGSLITPGTGTVTTNSIIDGVVTAAKLGTVYAANISGLDSISVANTQITGKLTSSQIIGVSNTQITGNIIASQITSVANTQVTGLITSGQIVSVANTQITGNIISSQISGLGTMSTQDASSVTITGGNVYGVGLKVEAATASANVLTLNYSNAAVFTYTATTNLAITPTNIPAQQGIMLLKLTNGGAYTVTYAGNCGFVSNTAPTLTSSGTDFLFIQGNATHYSVFTQLDVR